MAFLIELTAEGRLSDWRLFKKLTTAEAIYFKVFAAVVQQQLVPFSGGGLIKLTGCTLYEVGTMDQAAARAMVKNNRARRLHSSDDPLCGVPLNIDFRLQH